jgi:hypothetical protein
MEHQGCLLFEFFYALWYFLYRAGIRSTTRAEKLFCRVIHATTMSNIQKSEKADAETGRAARTTLGALLLVGPA